MLGELIVGTLVGLAALGKKSGSSAKKTAGGKSKKKKDKNRKVSIRAALDKKKGKKRKNKLNKTTNIQGRNSRDILDELKNIGQNEHSKRRSLYLQLSYIADDKSEKTNFKKLATDEGFLNQYKNSAESALNSGSASQVKSGLIRAKKGVQLASEKQQPYFENLVNKLEKRKEELEEKTRANLVSSRARAASRKEISEQKSEEIETDDDNKEEAEEDIAEENEEEIEEDDEDEDNYDDVPISDRGIDESYWEKRNEE